MSDKELCARLRLNGRILDRQTADRIEALTEQLEAARADAKEAEAYAEELEAKLAEAVERLQFLAEALPELGALAAGTTKYDVATLAIGEETMSLRFRDRGLAPKIPDEG